MAEIKPDASLLTYWNFIYCQPLRLAQDQCDDDDDDDDDDMMREAGGERDGGASKRDR